MQDYQESLQGQEWIHLRRYNSLSLRFIQLGAQLFIASIFAGSSVKTQSCSNQIITIIMIAGILLIITNAAFLLFIFIKKQYSKNISYAILGTEIIVAGVTMVIGLGEAVKKNKCANLSLFYQFIGLQSFIALVISILVMCGPFNSCLRYVNGPGNLVWAFLFLGNNWGQSYLPLFYIIGGINLVISILTALLNLLSFIMGLKNKIKKALYYEWIVGIGLLVVCTILCLVVYLNNVRNHDFKGIMGKKLCQTFIGVNITDIIFWVWGFFMIKNQYRITIVQSLKIKKKQTNRSNSSGEYGDEPMEI